VLLEALALDVGKMTRGRRGLPGHASLAWLDALGEMPALTRLDVAARWPLELNADLAAAAPALRELRLAAPEDDRRLELGAARLPPGLRALRCSGAVAWPAAAARCAPGLRELRICWPPLGAEAAAAGADVCPDAELSRALRALTRLTSLALGRIGAPLNGSLAALARLTGLRELRLGVQEHVCAEMAHVRAGETHVNRALRALTGLRVLHLQLPRVDAGPAVGPALRELR
jgi:hypothetical protein